MNKVLIPIPLGYNQHFTIKAGFIALLALSLCQNSAFAEEGKDPSLKPANLPEPITIRVPPLTAAPTVDGQLAEWTGIGGEVVKVPIRPAIEIDPENYTGNLEVEIYTGVHEGRFYLAARWPDNAADTSYRPWKWRGSSYEQDKKRFDDVFAVRFQLDGDYDSCMLSKKNYRVDVWHWSAGRSNAAGLAEDRYHTLSLKHQEDAAEIPSPYGTVYIADRRDAGHAIYTSVKPPKEKQAAIIPSTALTGKGSGSTVDVTARGEWKDGFWSLEMSRLLNTGNDDDAVLGQGKSLAAAVAVFNHASGEHKSVSGTLNLVFAP